jgi:hypothetical protein
VGGRLRPPRIAGPGWWSRCTALFVTILILWGGSAPEADAYSAGIFCDGPDSTCFTGVGSFDQFAWVRTPGDVGLVYVTLRISFPDNLDVRAAPQFDPRVLQFIKTDYPDGTEEWHMVVEGCPTGWIRVFRQRVTLLDDQPSSVVLHGGDSWIRDCNFDLLRVSVTNNLVLNDPACGVVDTTPGSWSALKARWE